MVLNSWCERLSIFSLLLVISIFIIDLNLNLLPIHGLWLCLYVSLLIISTIWIICVDIQKLLQKTSPFEYDFYSNSHYKKWLHLYEVIQQRVIGICCIQQEGQTPTIENRTILLEGQEGLKKSSIDERIELFVNDIQQRFLSKWYQMISEDPNFPHESKILLEGVIRRVLQVSVQLDGSQIVHGVIVILLKHLKEFRRSLKRLKKNGAGSSVEQVYRYSHIGNKSELAMEHFCHQLTANVLREFISWELLNSLPCRLFVSILSKRLTSYIIHYISQPGWINYKLLSELANEQDLISLKLDQFQFISLSDIHLSDDKATTTSTTTTTTIELKEVKNPENSSTPKMSPKRETSHNDHNDDDKVEQNVIENALTQLITQHTASILQRAEKTDNEFQPKRSEPVKIHSGKSTINRWDETELTNLSVGQDLLELDDLEDPGIEHFSGRRLWGAYNPEQDEKVDLVDPDLVVANREGMTRFEQKLSKRISPPALSSSIPHCLRPATTSASALYTNTIKPIAGNVTATTLHNMRELQQSTVNNVVKPVSHVTEKAIHKIGDLQDEAVGVVEGIFDFGMAGIRKGLRLTGLQDQEGKNNVPKLVKVGHVVSEEVKVKGIEDESCWMNPIAMMKEESPNGFENQILLEKSPNISETTTSDSTLLFTDSPEYEETADLASTIDKLRSLLQQKSSNSSLNTPAVSPMPLDDIVRAPIIEQDRGMQRFARTVTGMFNTFKTALPGNSEQVQAKEEKWLFIENETTDTDLPSLLNCLLVERRDYCTIDTAYEAMDSLDLLTESISSSNISKIHWENQRFVPDEPDDFDSQIPITKALVDLVCECLQDTNCALTQEPVIQALLLVAGTKTEQKLSEFAAKLIRITNRFIGPLPKQFNDDVLALSSEKMITMIEKTLPYYIQEIFGHEDLTTALKFFITSLQSMKINQDVVLQVFELVCAQLIYTSGQHSPTPSA